MTFNNFIPPELFPYLQRIANDCTDILRSINVLDNAAPSLSGRTVSIEILRAVCPNLCAHVLIVKFGKSNLYTCKGCFALFRSNQSDEQPIKLFELIEESLQHDHIKKFRNMIASMEGIRKICEIKELAMRNKILDLEYEHSKREEEIIP
tara:strand:+ start:5381 stop:5830 length:450 start_codon:yes stop_codon:yes gene_type:complete